jgi:hypothetical protein
MSSRTQPTNDSSLFQHPGGSGAVIGPALPPPTQDSLLESKSDAAALSSLEPQRKRSKIPTHQNDPDAPVNEEDLVL